jgi:hypothetical protein
MTAQKAPAGSYALQIKIIHTCICTYIQHTSRALEYTAKQRQVGLFVPVFGVMVTRAGQWVDSGSYNLITSVSGAVVVLVQ